MSISEIFGEIAGLFSWIANYSIQWDYVLVAAGAFTATAIVLGIVQAMHEAWNRR